MLKETIESIKHIGIAVIISILLTRYVGQVAVVNQISMQKTLYGGDVLWVEKVTSAFNRFKRGDIVTIYSPEFVEDKWHSLVKRIIALPEDYIEIKGGKVFVNGVAFKVDTSDGDNTTEPSNPKFNALTIPEGKVYVLGDNRAVQIHDSRDMGLIDMKNINSRAIFRIFPLTKIGSLVK